MISGEDRAESAPPYGTIRPPSIWISVGARFLRVRMGQAKKQRSAGHDGVARRTRFGWPALLLVALLAAGIGIAWHVRGHRQSSAAAQLADLRHAGYVEAAA